MTRVGWDEARILSMMEKGQTISPAFDEQKMAAKMEHGAISPWSEKKILARMGRHERLARDKLAASRVLRKRDRKRAFQIGAEARFHLSVADQLSGEVVGQDHLRPFRVLGRIGKEPALKAARIAATDTPAGKKIRLGRRFAKLSRRDPNVKKKFAEIALRARQGDPTAREQMATIHAGMIADRQLRRAYEIERTELLRMTNRRLVVRRRPAMRIPSPEVMKNVARRRPRPEET